MTGTKKILALAVCLSLGVGQAAWSQPADPPSEGEQILRKSEQAYHDLNSYVGTSAVVSVTDFGDSKQTSTAIASIEFVRPGKIRIYGGDEDGGGFTIISDGQKTWNSWQLIQGGAFQEAQSTKLAIAGMTGVAHNAPTLIPAALGVADISWAFSTKQRKGAALQGHERIGGEDCLKVQAEQSKSTWTFWVSSRDFLLRQAREEQDTEQLAEVQRTMREYRKLHPDPTFDEQLKTMTADERQKIEAMTPERRERLRQSIDHPRDHTMLWSTDLYIFSIDSVNKSVPDNRFQKP